MRDRGKTKGRLLDEARHNEQRSRALSDASFEAIAISRDGCLLDANTVFDRMFGFDLDELIGKDILLLTTPEDREMVMAEVLSGYDQPYETRAVRKDGSVIKVQFCG